MRVRQGLLWLHRYLGLGILGFLVLAGLTGSILVFRAPLDAALNPDLFSVSSEGPVRAPAKLADALQHSHPAWRVTRVELRLAPTEALVLNVSAAKPNSSLGFDEVFVDPHNGRIIGTRTDRPGWGRRHIVEGIFQFHQNLLASTAGRWVMGTIAIGWLVSNLIGLYLTFPSLPPFFRRWIKLWRVARGTRFPRFCLDLHRAGGLWLFLGFIVLALTSVEMNFYDELFMPAVNAIWSAPPSPFDADAPHLAADHQSRIGFAAGLAAASTIARQRHPDWVPVFATYAPQLGLYGVSFVAKGNGTYAWLGPVAYYVSDRSGRLVYADDPYREGARGAVLRSLYPLHSGCIFGWPTRGLIFLLGLATTILSLTGLYVWYRRR